MHPGHGGGNRGCIRIPPVRQVVPYIKTEEACVNVCIRDVDEVEQKEIPAE